MAIGLVKKKNAAPVRDTARERQVYKHVRENACKFGLDPSQVKRVYRQIVNMCSSVQDLKEKSE